MSSEEQLALIRTLTKMLHTSFYGSLYARREEGLFRSWQFCVEGANRIFKIGFPKLAERDLEETLAMLEKTGLYQNIELVKTDENKYKFKVGKCLFAGGANGIHKNLRNLDLPCILSLSVAGIPAFKNPTKKAYVYLSVLAEEGSETDDEKWTI